MEAKQIHEKSGQETFALVLDAGDEAVKGLTGFARENGLDAASITAIGAFSDATLGFFDIEEGVRSLDGVSLHRYREARRSGSYLD